LALKIKSREQVEAEFATVASAPLVQEA
ncbi:MAG: hypothetical protein H6Q86_5303, partial [candidate division NC10 bacterium]|nr:hypothetical protein [candidate division NC10 bacterium]